MDNHIIFIPKMTSSLKYASEFLQKSNYIFSESPEKAGTILFPVPCPGEINFTPNSSQIIIGGNLAVPSRNIDLLNDPMYLAQNAKITAEAAFGLILQQLPDLLEHSPILVLGWGRIGKCLSKLLQNSGSPVSVYARKEKDRAEILSLGYKLFNPSRLSEYACIVNTATGKILSDTDHIQGVMIDLASQQYLPGKQVIHARGLPGKYRPKASGKLIAETIIRLLEGDQE